MTKEQAKELLEQGKRIDETFTLSEGQDCMIYKGEWPDGGLSVGSATGISERNP